MEKRHLLRSAARAVALLACAIGGAAPAAAAAAGDPALPAAHDTIIVPPSSVARPEDAGIRAHTNIRFLVRKGRTRLGDSYPSGTGESPASLACVYGLTAHVDRCNPETLTTVATGGSKAIAIVDAYDYPTAASDLGEYSRLYGLPAVTGSNFQVVYAAGSEPKRDPTGGWALEQALDIDMAHALAPNARIYLVEAASDAIADLLAAEAVAAKLVAGDGGGEVSNSWGSGETYDEEATESDFSVPGVVFFASAGDAPGTSWPSVLSNVVAVGGTDIERDNNGAFFEQLAWSMTGGGFAAYVTRPGYQDGIEKILSWHRGVPDIAFVSDSLSYGYELPNVWVYDTTPYHRQTLDWVEVGGTSVGSPASAAIVNNAGRFLGSTPAELTQMYAATRKARAFNDIDYGGCYANQQDTPAVTGWDFCTGIGAPFGTADK